MSIINYAARVINFKVVYYGPGLAGKTANLQNIHQVLPDGNKGKMISLATGDDRTLFFDFLPVSALGVRGFTTRFQLYTVPGPDALQHDPQARAARGGRRGVRGRFAVGPAAGQRRELSQPRREPQGVRLDLATIPLRDPVQQARPGPSVAPVDYMEFLLNRGERRVPTFEAVAVDGTGVFDTLNTVSRMVLVKEFGQVQEAGA